MVCVYHTWTLSGVTNSCLICIPSTSGSTVCRDRAVTWPITWADSISTSDRTWRPFRPVIPSTVYWKRQTMYGAKWLMFYVIVLHLLLNIAVSWWWWVCLLLIVICKVSVTHSRKLLQLKHCKMVQLDVSMWVPCSQREIDQKFYSFRKQSLTFNGDNCMTYCSYGKFPWDTKQEFYLLSLLYLLMFSVCLLIV